MSRLGFSKRNAWRGQRVWPTAVACACLLLQLLQAQSADTLGTKLTVTGDVLNFRWDPKHPWAGQMSAAGVELFADYTTARQGRVIEKLTAGRPAGADTSVSLKLPNTLAAVPQGNVCLYLQVARGHRIPLRKPRGGDADTEHFGVPSWRTEVLGNTTEHTREARLQALESAVAAGAAEVKAQETAMQAKHWIDATACNAVQAPEFVARTKPADVLPSDQHEAEARHLCIRRAVFLRDALLKRATPGQPGNLTVCLPDPTLSGDLIRYLHGQKRVDAEDLRLREAEFARYKSDWNLWQSVARDEIQRNVTPLLGGNDDELKLQDVTAEVGYEILSYANPASPVLDLSKHPAVQDVLGYVGGGMETYTRCVHDGQDELAAKLRVWNEQVERAPMLEKMSQEQLRTQCLNAWSGLDKQRADLRLLEQQLAAERQAHPSAGGPVASSAVAAGTVLNQSGCMVR